MTQVEVWLRGPVNGVPNELMPVAHALLQAREDLERLVAPLSRPQLWVRPGGAASVGFHVLHLQQATDRLFTYSRGEALTPRQREALALEQAGGDSNVPASALLSSCADAVDAFVDQLRHTDPTTLDEVRAVGRARLPSSVRGLLFHAAEHAHRHVGQVATTLIIQRGLSG